MDQQLIWIPGGRAPLCSSMPRHQPGVTRRADWDNFTGAICLDLSPHHPLASLALLLWSLFQLACDSSQHGGLQGAVQPCICQLAFSETDCESCQSFLCLGSELSEHVCLVESHKSETNGLHLLKSGDFLPKREVTWKTWIIKEEHPRMGLRKTLFKLPSGFQTQILPNPLKLFTLWWV